MNVSDESQRFFTQNSPAISRTSLFSLRYNNYSKIVQDTDFALFFLIGQLILKDFCMSKDKIQRILKNILFSIQLYNHNAIQSNYPDPEVLINQLNGKQEQINTLNDDVKKLKTQMEQKQRNIKNYEDLIQFKEKASNFRMLANEGRQKCNQRAIEINLKRNQSMQQQEIEKLQKQIKELKENMKAKELSKLEVLLAKQFIIF